MQKYPYPVSKPYWNEKVLFCFFPDWSLHRSAHPPLAGSEALSYLSCQCVQLFWGFFSPCSIRDSSSGSMPEDDIPWSVSDSETESCEAWSPPYLHVLHDTALARCCISWLFHWSHSDGFCLPEAYWYILLQDFWLAADSYWWPIHWVRKPLLLSQNTQVQEGFSLWCFFYHRSDSVSDMRLHRKDHEYLLFPAPDYKNSLTGNPLFSESEHCIRSSDSSPDPCL